jgi:hypothetical protein
MFLICLRFALPTRFVHASTVILPGSFIGIFTIFYFETLELSK